MLTFLPIMMVIGFRLIYYKWKLSKGEIPQDSCQDPWHSSSTLLATQLLGALHPGTTSLTGLWKRAQSEVENMEMPLKKRQGDQVDAREQAITPSVQDVEHQLTCRRTRAMTKSKWWVAQIHLLDVNHEKLCIHFVFPSHSVVSHNCAHSIIPTLCCSLGGDTLSISCSINHMPCILYFQILSVFLSHFIELHSCAHLYYTFYYSPSDVHVRGPQ
jgi:hypothetical protein